MANFESSTLIPVPAEKAFDFMIRPANLVRISPSQAPMEIVKAPEVFTASSQYEFTLGGFGPLQRMTHEITELVRPTKYVEKAVKGPISHWIHQHIFEPKGPSEVLVIDRIE